MEGVKILETIVTPITELQNAVVAMAITLVATGLCIAYGIYHFSSSDWEKESDLKVLTDFGLCIALLAIPFIVLVPSVALIVKEVPVGEEYTYKVAISEDVSFVEFYSKYEILEQDGSVYTIKERVTETS